MTAADVAAAMGRDLPAPIRLDRAAYEREQRALARQRHAERIAEIRARRPRNAREAALLMIADSGDRLRAMAASRDALRSDLDAIAGDTDRALGPGWRKQ